MSKVIKKNREEKDLFQFSILGVVPFILILIIGIFQGDITLHQKVFKTLLINIGIWVLIAILFFLSLRAQAGSILLPEKKIKYLGFFAAYLFYVAIQYFTGFFSGEIIYDANYHFSNYILLTMLAFFFFFFLNSIDDVKVGLIVVQLFMVVIFLMSMFEFFELVNVMKEKGNFSWAQFFSEFRPKVNFGNTDYFSGFMAGILPLTLLTPLILFRKTKSVQENKANRIIVISTIITAIMGLVPFFFSQTKAAWGGLAVGIILVWVIVIMILKQLKLYLRLIIMVTPLVIIISVLGIMLATGSPVIKNIAPRVLVAFQKPQFIINDRLNGWSGGLGLLKNHPVTGAGLGSVYASSFKYMNKFYYIYSDSNSFKHSHCEYVEILGEGGIVGITLFLGLVGFILIMMFRRVFSSRYRLDYRLIALGIAAGIISMMIHQMFSLSLRMSATMMMWFTLMGLGVFVISWSKKALLESAPEAEPMAVVPFYEHSMTPRFVMILSGVLTVFAVTGFILFYQVFACENALNKSMRNTDEGPDFYLEKAVKIMPGNPYAWTQRYTFASQTKLRYLLDQVPADGADPSFLKQFYDRYDQIYAEAILCLDKLNGIIPGYQDVWSKYANTYITRYQMMQDKFRRTRDYQALKEAESALRNAYQAVNKSLQMNYLNLSMHTYKLVLLTALGDSIEYDETIKDYIVGRIYVDYAKGRKIIKERFDIRFSDTETAGVELKDTVYYFTIPLNAVKRIKNILQSLNDADQIETSLKTEVNKMMAVFSPKVID